jgi:hypothetical protein
MRLPCETLTLAFAYAVEIPVALEAKMFELKVESKTSDELQCA